MSHGVPQCSLREPFPPFHLKIFHPQLPVQSVRLQLAIRLFVNNLLLTSGTANRLALTWTLPHNPILWYMFWIRDFRGMSKLNLLIMKNPFWRRTKSWIGQMRERSIFCIPLSHVEETMTRCIKTPGSVSFICMSIKTEGNVCMPKVKENRTLIFIPQSLRYPPLPCSPRAIQQIMEEQRNTFVLKSIL